MQTLTPTTTPQFPYAGTDPATFVAIGSAIAGVENMIHQAVRKAFPRRCEDDRNEMAQVVRVHLWTKSIPKFDATRGVKLTTFLHTCIRMRVKQFRPRRPKTNRVRSLRPFSCLDRTPNRFVPAIRPCNDRAIERRARAVIADQTPLGLSAIESEVFTALINAPSETTYRTIARTVGIGPSALSATLRRISRKVREKIASDEIALG